MDTSILGQIRTLLLRPQGVTVAEIEDTFNYAPHEVHRRFSALRKQGHDVHMTKEGRENVYKIIVPLSKAG